MDKLKMHSPNLVDQNIDKLAQLFPNCVTETQGDDGKLRKAIDFDQLKQELSRNIVEGPQERYQLNWPGKREALLTANAPIAKTLRPCREESVNLDEKAVRSKTVRSKLNLTCRLTPNICIYYQQQTAA